MLEGHGVAADQQGATDAAGESDHPGERGRRHHHQAEAADGEAGHDRGADDLRARVERREDIERNREEDGGADEDFADQLPQRHPVAGAADAGDRLMTRELHQDEIDDPDAGGPGQQPVDRDHAPQVRDEDQGGNDVGGGEEWSELSAGDHLDVAQRRGFRLSLARGDARRFPAGKPRGHHPLVTIWSLVHPPAVPRPKAGLKQRELKRS